MIKINKHKLIFILILAFLLGALAAALLVQGFDNSANLVKVNKQELKAEQEMLSKYSKVEALYQYIDQNYYEDIDQEKLIEGMCKGLVAGLNDQYSQFMTKDELEGFMVNMSEDYDGIGIVFTSNVTGKLMVMSVVDDSPAEKAGIIPGDLILMVNDEVYDFSTMDEAASIMRGEEGTTVKLTIYRDDKLIEKTVTRENIKRDSVSAKTLDGNIGYIRISTFTADTAEKFENELRNFEMKGVKGLVVDLRNNGGGVVDSGVKIADLLLPEAKIVSVKNKNGEKQSYTSDANKTELKVVALINESSASTSEVLASALLDNGIDLVGTTSFGKGIIQEMTTLKDGTAIKLTTMEYYSPKGHKINKLGVTPNYVVEDYDEQLEKAIELLNN